MSFLAQVVVNAIALFVLDHLMSGVNVVIHSGQAVTAARSSGDVASTIVIYLAVGLVLALLTTFVKPLLQVLALPLYVVTLGLFGLVINGFILILVSKVTPLLGFGLQVASFGTAVWAGVVLAVLTALISIPFKKRARAA